MSTIVSRETILQKQNHFDVYRSDFYGGLKGSRTPDLCNANAALYQLSYQPIIVSRETLYVLFVINETLYEISFRIFHFTQSLQIVSRETICSTRMKEKILQTRTLYV